MLVWDYQHQTLGTLDKNTKMPTQVMVMSLLECTNWYQGMALLFLPCQCQEHLKRYAKGTSWWTWDKGWLNDKRDMQELCLWEACRLPVWWEGRGRKKPNQYVHIDLWGPASVMSLGVCHTWCWLLMEEHWDWLGNPYPKKMQKQLSKPPIMPNPNVKLETNCR